jgi:DnaJ like chaperone protein
VRPCYWRESCTRVDMACLRFAEKTVRERPEPATRWASMVLIVLLALLGFFVGRLRGAVVGALIGYFLNQIFQKLAQRALGNIGTQFLDSTFAVMGALCKADGIVSKNEIRAAEEAFVRLRLTPEQVVTAKAAFSRGKGADFNLDVELDKFRSNSGKNPLLYQMFLQVQFAAVAADGEMHPAERAMLEHIATRLGLDPRILAQLEALLRGAQYRNTARESAPPPRARLDDAYAALGVHPDATDEEVKRAYRKLIAENHPDRLAAQGLPENLREIAEQKSREINAAYDLIKKARASS